MDPVIPAAPVAPVVDAEDAAEVSHAPAWFPPILLHIFYPTSRKVGFGWALFIVSTLATFFMHKPSGDPKLDASTWLICVAFSSALIGGGTLPDSKLDLERAKLNAGPAAPAGA